MFVGLFYHYALKKRLIVSRQGKKNAKVKDTEGVKYIAMERRTPLAVLKLPNVFIQVVELYQRAAKTASFISPPARTQS